MKLTVGRHVDTADRVFIAAPTGLLGLETVARARGQSLLDGIRDVGDLLSRGDAAWELALSLAADAGDLDLPRYDDAKFTFGPPVARPSAFVCIGRNYLEHVKEGSAQVPSYPMLFAKFANTLTGHRSKVLHPRITKALDYEGELAFIIRRRASRLAAKDSGRFVAGYTILNDISARDLQSQDMQWIRGKSLDCFAPLGPIFVSADEIQDVDRLVIQTWVNGDLRQKGTCGEMIFKIPQLLEFITEAITLEPGDLVSTGTPSGVAAGMNPPRWLRPGDTVQVQIDEIGTLANQIA